MRPRILVVDDEKSMQELMRHTLSLSGFDVSLASDAAEFRKVVFKEKPQAILLDILLGDRDGIQVYEELLRDGLDSSIPVIFVSALAQDRPPAYSEPGRSYSLIGKPFDGEELVKRLYTLTEAAA